MANKTHKISRPVFQIGAEGNPKPEATSLGHRGMVGTKIYSLTECTELAFLRGEDFKEIFGEYNADYGSSLAVVKITNPITGMSVHRLFRTCPDLNLPDGVNYVALTYTSLLRLSNSRESFKSMNQLIISKGCKWLYYWNHPFPATKVSVRLGVIGIMLSLVGIVVSLFSKQILS